MTADQLPADGELRLGPVTLPAGQRLFTFAPEPVVWATNQPVPEPGRLWSQLSGLLPVECAGHTGLARTTIPEIAPALVNSAVWSFWWD
jgi:hypothetical protein